MSYSAESYENYMVTALFAPWAARLMRAAEPLSGERVLDIACGTGIVARSTAPYLGAQGNIIGLELNHSMLTVARSVAEREGHVIEWVQGRAERLPFRAGSFDLVVCQFALMFFADQRFALADMRRVLTSGGRVVLSVWQGLNRHPVYQALHEASQQRLGRSAVEHVFSLGDVEQLRRLLAASGFERIDIESVSLTARFPNPDEFFAWEVDVDPAAIPSLQHLDDQSRQAIMDSIRVEMEAKLREFTEADHVVLPFHAYIVYAQ